jgi:hypothetical protein
MKVWGCCWIAHNMTQGSLLCRDHEPMLLSAHHDASQTWLQTPHALPWSALCPALVCVCVCRRSQPLMVTLSCGGGLILSTLRTAHQDLWRCIGVGTPASGEHGSSSSAIHREPVACAHMQCHACSALTAGVACCGSPAG